MAGPLLEPELPQWFNDVGLEVNLLKRAPKRDASSAARA